MRRFFIAFIVLSGLASCVSGTFLRTERIRQVEGVEGTYRLILYGAEHIDDLETAAFLDLEGDGYRFAPYAPEYSYTVYEGLSAGKAFQAAEHFVSFHRNFSGFLMKRVLSNAGTVVGYEVRPLYEFFVFGNPDVLDIGYYEQGDGTIKVIVRLKPEILRQREIGRFGHDR